MYILGIESTCDETAVAVIERGTQNRVMDEQIKSQIPIHAKFGGVVPEIASRTHYEVIDSLTLNALKNSGLTIKDIDLIAYAQGPGLIGSLLIGLSFAKGLALANKIPFIGVDHILAHIESAFIENPGIEYPLIALVASGGHTTLFYQTSRFNTEIISKTRDDAVGEVMDKIAKFFGLGYPGGPILDKMYPQGNNLRFKFTEPKMSDGSNDFSFSGYKTAVIYHPEVKDTNPSHQTFKDLISSFLYSVVNYLLKKTASAVKDKKPESVILSGGVSRNALLREVFKKKFKVKDDDPVHLYLPSLPFCTDNASMIAWLGYEKYIYFPKDNYYDFSQNVYSRAHFRESGKHR